MIRFILICILVGGFLFFSFPVWLILQLVGKVSPKAKADASFRIVLPVLHGILKIGGARLTVVGRENIPDDRPVLYVANHRSYVDPVIGYTLIKGRCGFIAKKELTRHPFLPLWMENLHCLFLDRSTPRAGLKTILTAISYVKQGISIWIFPEGTAQDQSNELLPFKEGSFKIAEKAGCLVIPVAISRADHLYERQKPRVVPEDITVQFGKPIDPKDFPKDAPVPIGVYARSVIQQMLDTEAEEYAAKQKRS